jgi:chromate reductase
MRLLGISGSLRADSYNSRLLEEVLDLLPAGVEMTVYDGLREIPPFDEDLEHEAPPAVQRLREAIAEADGLLFATPEYNSSVPGALKNALDWVSRPIGENPTRDKSALVIGASRSMFGAVWAQAELRKVLAAMGARVVDRELPVPQAHERLAQDGQLLDEELRAELVPALGELVEEIERDAAALA